MAKSKCPNCGQDVPRAEGHTLGWKLLCERCTEESHRFEIARFYGVEPGDGRRAVQGSKL